MQGALLRRSLWSIPVLVACAAAQPTVRPAEVIAPPPRTETEPAQEDAAPAPSEDAASPPSAGGLLERLSKAKVESARVSALSIGSAVQMWQTTQRGDSCPRHDELIRDHVLPPDSDNRDPWGSPYRIECSDTGVVVTSDGPDGEPGTADDVTSAER